MEETAPSSRAWWKYLVWGVVAVAVFGLSVGGGFLAATRQSGGKLLEVENKQGLYTPEVSDKGLEAYLKYAGLSEQVERVILTYEPAELAEMAYTRLNREDMVDVMIDLKVEEKVVRLWMYYNPELFEHMLASPERLAGDVLAGICLALNPGTMPDCMKQAFEYIEWAAEAGVPAVIQPAKERSGWRLVPQTYAQSCSGTVPCGGDETKCSCSGNGATCNFTGQLCDNGLNGTCSCVTTCNTGLNNLQCSALTNQNACNSQGKLSNCDKQCSGPRPDTGNYCTWGGGSNPTPTPTDAPTCDRCQAWQDDTCGPPSCAANKRYQSRNCYNIEGCATTRCVSDSSCSATPTPTSCPTVTTPGELTATYNGGASSTFGWNAVSNSSTPVTYGLQIDNLGSRWTSDTCAGTVQGGDTCNLSYTGTSFTRATNLGNSYSWRVRAKNNCGNTSYWTAWTNYNVPTPPNCTSFGGATSIARNSSSTYQVFASGDPTRGQLAWRCGAGGTWGAWQLLGDLTQAPPYTFDFNSDVSCGNANQSQPIQMAVNLYRGSCNDDSCRDLSPQKTGSSPISVVTGRVGGWPGFALPYAAIAASIESPA